VERPVPPPATEWAFPCSAGAQEALAGTGEVVGIGADLQPGTLLAAYRCGLFPMPVAHRLAWWSPEPRGVIPLKGLIIRRSLRKSCRRYEIRVDTAFEQVVAACADPSRRGAWIDRRMLKAYLRLHELGWAHSVEAWSTEGVSGEVARVGEVAQGGKVARDDAVAEGGQLAGGLYGVAIGGLFAGESMFYRQRDASKVALIALVEALRNGGGHLLDVQWLTPHLASLGAVEVSRRRYHELLRDAVDLPQLNLEPQLCPGWEA
jgi:leucyl/phenylalanyl-tRNA--protein transferase